MCNLNPSLSLSLYIYIYIYDPSMYKGNKKCYLKIVFV